MLAFVALLREPMALDPAVLARVAGKLWDADLGDGSSEGVDGFVVCNEAVNMIKHESRFFMINNFAIPYVPDVEAGAEGIKDMRIKSLFLEHRAWFSCDALGVDAETSEDELLDLCQRLGKLFAEFLDENCLLIYLPDINHCYPINKDTIQALCSDNPMSALRQTMTEPIIAVHGDDKLMVQAVENARRNWPQFVAAFEANAGANFSIKSPITYRDNTEYIWIAVTAIEGERIYGTLANEPGNLGSLRIGSNVVVPVEDLNDWCYLNSRGEFTGGFTLNAVANAAQRKGKRRAS